MISVIEKTLLELFRLLGFEVEIAKKTVKELLSKIEEEAVFETHEGIHNSKKDKIKNLDQAAKALGDEVFKKIVETASSKILVAYFANNKKGYTENQKEVFLTFLLTNKIHRELEKAT